MGERSEGPPHTHGRSPERPAAAHGPSGESEERLQQLIPRFEDLLDHMARRADELDDMHDRLQQQQGQGHAWAPQRPPSPPRDRPGYFRQPPPQPYPQQAE